MFIIFSSTVLTWCCSCERRSELPWERLSASFSFWGLVDGAEVESVILEGSGENLRCRWLYDRAIFEYDKNDLKIDQIV